MQLSDAIVFKFVRSTPSLMKPVRSIIRENRLDPDSPHALSQLIIVSRITKNKRSYTVRLFRDFTMIKEQKKKKWSHNSQ